MVRCVPDTPRGTFLPNCNPSATDLIHKSL
jgi:hypothetical protein